MNRGRIHTNVLALALVGAFGTVPTFAQENVTLTYLIDNAPSTVAANEALVAAFEAEHPNISVEIETRPGGGEGDNIVKTRLATGEMTDVFWYNSGSLFQAINPTQNLVELTGDPMLDRVIDSFFPTVTADDGIYGVPGGTAMGGGILYNRAIYDELGLEVPTSWDEFMANNAAIEAAGYDAVIQSFGATWTSQLFVLADYYNVQAAEPDFADRYTNNEAKYATSPAALRGFELQQEVFNEDLLNADFAVATFEDALAKLANKEGAHYPMLTFAVGSIRETYPDKVDDIGFFAVPGDNPDVNGLTVWAPAGIYIANTSEHVDEAKMFLDFITSVQGCDIQTEAVGATGPYMVEGCTLPDDVAPAIADMMPYFEREGATAPALEFLSPIKGPNLEHILVEVGSGGRSPLEGAELYDEDVRKQAQQLGLPGW